MNETRAYVADGIFDGESWFPGHALVTTGKTVSSIVPQGNLPSGVEVITYNNAVITPAFTDIQIYGASQKLFSAYPSVEALQLLSDNNRRGGTALCLPTIATNSNDVIRQGIEAIRSYWSKGGKGIYGLHLEGPWINASRKGAHIEEYISRPVLDEVKALVEYGGDVIRMVTLAPEVCDQQVINYLHAENIIVSAGHSNATYQQATVLFNQGIRTATHLFNAMSPMQHRAPGLAGAILDHDSVMASIIPDGVHVDFATVSIAKKIMGERLFVITDAVTETGIGPYKHVKAGNRFESDGILSGSALELNAAVRNLVEKVGITMDEAIRMCSLYPARVLGISHRVGMLKQGFDLAAVVLDKEFNVVELLD